MTSANFHIYLKLKRPLALTCSLVTLPSSTSLSSRYSTSRLEHPIIVETSFVVFSSVKARAFKKVSSVNSSTNVMIIKKELEV